VVGRLRAHGLRAVPAGGRAEAGAALLASWAAGAGTPLPDALAILLGAGVLVLTLKLPHLLRAPLTGGLDFARYYAYRAGGRLLDSGPAAARGAAGRSAAGAVARAAPFPPARAAAAAVRGRP
jgi:hypothetical protein